MVVKPEEGEKIQKRHSKEPESSFDGRHSDSLWSGKALPEITLLKCIWERLYLIDKTRSVREHCDCLIFFGILLS